VEDKGEMQDTREWLREEEDSGKVEREKDRVKARFTRVCLII
jgi:hypothetical protein